LTLNAATGIVNKPDLFVFIEFFNSGGAASMARSPSAAAAAAAEWVAT
jgi:hypothetical protein